MLTKIFEVRDRATCIPMLATLMTSEDLVEHRNLRRAGYGSSPLIMITPCIGGESKYASYKWCPVTQRTYYHAHKFIEENFNELPTGAVVDVEYILGETTKPKESELL